MNLQRLIPLMLSTALLGSAIAGCDESQKNADASAMTVGGDPDRGRDTIRAKGCGTCHTIPGIHGADALVGPPLDRIGSRAFVGGVVRNTPDNLISWIQNPPALDEKTAMPNLGVTPADARDIAAYLYTLR